MTKLKIFEVLDLEQPSNAAAMIFSDKLCMNIYVTFM